MKRARPLLLLVACAGAFLGATPQALAATAIGKITRIYGDAMGTVEGTVRPMLADDVIYLDETVATGAEARLELTFDDSTILTVGEKASVHLDQFVYRPDASVVKVSLAG